MKKDEFREKRLAFVVAAIAVDRTADTRAGRERESVVLTAAVDVLHGAEIEDTDNIAGVDAVDTPRGIHVRTRYRAAYGAANEVGNITD